MPIQTPWSGLLKVCEEFKRNFVSTIESYERDLIVTLIFSSLFSVKIFSFLSVGVGTLSNDVKSCAL